MIVGIDPGFKGAIALYAPDSGWLEIHDMPVFPAAGGKTEINHAELLEIMRSTGDATATAWLEVVQSRPGQNSSAVFRFGQGYGALECACAATGKALRYVTPAKWKKHFGLKADKGGSRAVACQRFPKHAGQFARVKDDGRAEAALIALYGAEMARVTA